jgi:hypothetical protein
MKSEELKTMIEFSHKITRLESSLKRLVEATDQATAAMMALGMTVDTIKKGVKEDGKDNR